MADHEDNKLTVWVAYSRLWRDWLKPHSKLLFVTLFMMILIALASAGYAKFMELVIDAFDVGGTNVIVWGPLGIIALTMIRGLSQYFSQIIQNKVLTRVQAQMQGQMLHNLLYMDLANLLNEAPASLATRFTADIELVRVAAKEMFTSITSVFTLIATFIVMLSIDWAMTIGLILIFSLALWPVGIVGSHVRKISAATQKEIGGMVATVNESISSIRMVRTYRLEEKVYNSADEIFVEIFRLRVKIMRWMASVSPILEILAGLATAALLFLVAWRLQLGTIDLGVFIGLLTALGVMTTPARKLGASYAVALQGVAALERVYSLYDTKNAINDGDYEYPEGEKAKGRLEFRNVNFVYPDGYQALHDVNLQIEAGKTYAFVGRSGAGKSTIFNLLPRLFDITSGEILLDGADIRGHKLSALRDQISVVSQDSVLLSGTVIENIGFGHEGASEPDCIKAAKAAAAHGFIRKLEDGYNTIIDPAKAKFSGGERQRLSIARAIVRDAPILLLDEPTSALDAESEKSIREALDKLSEGRTTLVIAHRLATIMDADQIVVMDQGRVVDQGTHEELLERGGIYAEFYTMQFNLTPPEPAPRRRSFTQGMRSGLKNPLDTISKIFGL